MKCTLSLCSALVRTLLSAAIAALLPVLAQATIFNVANGDVAGLIAAINSANSSAGANTINLAAGGTYTLTAVNNTYYYTGPSGLPTVNGQIVINGNGATIQRSSVSGTPDFRIFMVYGDLTLNEVTIRGGRSAQGQAGQSGGGGGIRIDGGKLLLVKSTVTENSGSNVLLGTGDNGGGGIFNFVGGQLTVINSTISRNTGYGGRTGGGILNLTHINVSKTTIINSTIFENRADGPAGFQGRGDAIADNFSPAGSIIIKNSILASPTQGAGNDFFQNTGGPIPWTSLGHNIVSDSSGGLAGPGDLISGNPLLGPLANNGGPTWTHAPLTGSPAINAVPIADCTDANGVAITIDQRGAPRPQGAVCDIGSVEKCASLGLLSYFFNALPTHGPVCASVFPVQFQASNLVAGTYTAKLQDSSGNVTFDFAPTVSGNFVNALFDLTGLSAGLGTVSIQPPGECVFKDFPFTIDPCPGGSGVQVRLYGAATLRPGRTFQYVVSVINFDTTPSANPLSVDVGGIPQASEIMMIPPGSAAVFPSPPPQGFTVNVPAGLAAGSSADFVFELTADFPSVGSTYPLAAQFTSGAVGSDSLPITVIASMDPNEKTGPPGVGPMHYLKGDSMLAYNIVFENDPLLASAPAQQVVIFDQLDPAKVNLGTFLFGPITFGHQLVTPPFRQNPFSVLVPYDVDGNPLTTADNIAVQIDGNLDLSPFSLSYGQITWTFQSIDPSTGLPPADPFIGFLPPDILPPEGQGGVSFQILPRSTLVTGNIIANRAAIVFDVNYPIVTPTWVNRIDKTRPASQIDALAAVQASATFPLTWSGTDVGAGIARYHIYVSEDGGPYSLLITSADTSTVFSGTPEKSYAFYSIAEDKMGHLEAAPAVPDARVKGASEQVSDLCALVQSMPIQNGLKNALCMTLQAAACGPLQAFIDQVNAQKGKKLTPAQASQLIDEATRIRAALGC